MSTFLHTYKRIAWKSTSKIITKLKINACGKWLKKMRKFRQNVTYLALNFDRARSAFLTDVTYIQRAPSLVLFTPLDRSLPPTTSSLGSIRGIKFKLVNFKLPSMALIWAPPLCHFELKGHKIFTIIIIIIFFYKF